jgi:glutathione S-transferase
MLKLYDLERSGNCYKVRLLLSLLGLAYERVGVGLAAGEHKQPAYLAINPLGQVPALADDGVVLRDSQAILVYLARKSGGEDWLPADAEGLARVTQWLSFAANELNAGCARARAIIRFGRKGHLGDTQTFAASTLAVLDAHLGGRRWLECGRPTIADIACYPYVALAPEGEVPLDAFAAVRAWIGRVEALPGYTPMSGLPRGA